MSGTPKGKKADSETEQYVGGGNSSIIHAKNGVNLAEKAMALLKPGDGGSWTQPSRGGSDKRW